MRGYILSPEAADDLQSIREYLRQQAGPRIAKSVIERIKAALRFLGDAPNAGHSREDLTPDDVKFWAVFSYMIVYKVSSQPIEIARILHGARDLEAILRNED